MKKRSLAIRKSIQMKLFRRIAISVAALVLVFLLLVGGYIYWTSKEFVTFYPAHGYVENGKWKIPVALWVHQRRPIARWVAKQGAGKFLGATDEEMKKVGPTVRDFVADGERGKTVTFKIEGHPGEYRLTDDKGQPVTTGKNGFAEGVVELTEDAAAQLLKQQSTGKGGWLSVAVGSGQSLSGDRRHVRLIPPGKGVMVISDIDDTVKITRVPLGKREMMKNTFLREYQATEGVADMYKKWHQEGADFAYVSGGFYQLYEPLSEFLFDEKKGKFPIGAMQMRHAPTDILSPSTKWIPTKMPVEKLENVTPDEKTTGTQEYKVKTIAQIIERFPEKSFILVGDSGEQDPQVYREIKKRFPNRDITIYLRDVVKGMSVEKWGPGAKNDILLIDPDTGKVTKPQ
jgi:hypothetical protein